MDLIPYVVRQGDYLQKLAQQHGFDADVVWANPTNAKLRALRPSMNMLCPGDVLYLPEAKRTWLPVNVGAMNRFVATVRVVHISATIRYAGQPLASAPYCVRELSKFGTLATDASGQATFDAPVTREFVTLDFEAPGLSVVLKMGHLDPIDSPSGICQRLSNLGYPAAQPDDPCAVSEALAMFQLGQDGLEADGVLNDRTRRALESAHGS
jgi:hypothetical protein